MEADDESILTGYPNILSYECTKKILTQMEKYICKIKIGNEQGTGFFCKIPFPDKKNMLTVLITNNHVINQVILYKENSKIDIYIKEETDIKEINLDNRLKYTNEKYDVTIIELKEQDNIKNYLELDDNIINNIINNINKNKEYIDETIYIIQYPEGKLSVSYGILHEIIPDKKYKFKHKCSTKSGSSGSPILNIDNKVIGIHRKGGGRNNLGSFLNYPIKEFIELNYKNNNIIININELPEDVIINEESEMLLKEIKKKYKKYNLDINNTKDEAINLIEKQPDINEILKELCLIEFKQLKELRLGLNAITDITVLEKAKFEKLEILNLRNNNISDISVLEKVNFKELKNLSLYANKISDIKVLERVKFEKLERLNLGYNKISDINILEKVNFKELKILYLDRNNISDIKVLENVKFEKLERLYLSENNKISDINVLEKVNFKELKELYLHNNNISDISVFGKIKFEKLEKLNLENNKIDTMKNISIKLKLKFKLKEFKL